MYFVLQISFVLVTNPLRKVALYADKMHITTKYLNGVILYMKIRKKRGVMIASC